MRKVCFVIDELGFGGTETHLLQLINGLDRARIQPYLCLLDGTSLQSQSLEPEDCEVMRCRVKSLTSIHAARRLFALVSQLRKWQIDTVQCFFPDSVYFGLLAGKLAGVPNLLKSRRDLFYWVTGAHQRFGKRLDNLYNRFLVTGLVANCNACVEAAKQAENPAPGPAYIISNGVDIHRYEASRTTVQNRSPVTIGILSMLRPEKRVDLFVEAALILRQQGREYEFMIAGDGPERAKLESLAASGSQHTGIRFVGRVKNTPQFLSKIDVGVLSSDTEGQSNSLIEYIASGKPIVATAVGGNRELVEHDVNGLLTPCGDAEKLAKAIDQIASSPAKMRAFSENNIKNANRFSLDSCIRQYQQLVESLPPGRRKKRDLETTGQVA